MDTPERNQIGTPKAKFEDSPVFNYLNSLSPIKPVKSVHFTQTFSSLSFASPPSVFTSPHVSSHKESRFLKRHNASDDLSKPEFSLESGDKASASEDAAQLYNNSSKVQEDYVSVIPVGDASVEPPNEHSKFVIELPRNLKYDCGSPDCNTSRCGIIKEDLDSELVELSASVAQYVQETSDKGSSDDEARHQMTCQGEQRKEGTGCDWESLISNAADIFIFDSPSSTEAFKELMNHSLDPMTRFSTSIMPYLPQHISDEQLAQAIDTISSGQQVQIDDHRSSQNEEASELKETEHIPNHVNECMVNIPIVKEDDKAEASMQLSCKPSINLHRGLRRRCLDFEMTGARRKSFNDVSDYSSSMLPQSSENITTTNKQLRSTKPSGEPSRCILPGIGLHLNALATTSKDYKSMKKENSASGRELARPNSNVSIHSPKADQGSVYESFPSASSERDMDGTENGVQLSQDASQSSALLANEDFNQSSPKKKRRKAELTGEGEACKRCNCKKSKCLKLYCECFAAGVYCIEPCSCQDCFNKPIHEDTVLATRKQIESRNPLAFAPKVIRNSDSAAPEYGDESTKTPASARHKRGCNCKKSNCLKKYCECYQGGVGCSIGCRCEGCKNAFGTKEGSINGTEAELDEEETEAAEKSVADRDQQKNEIQKHEEQTSALPTTPLRLSRQLVPVSFSSKSKPPRSSVFSIGGSTSGMYASQKIGKPNILRPQSKLDQRHSQTVQEDEMPDILQGDCSPNSGVKIASPNSKRISPPCTFGSSPGRRSGRKLILQSIPSFPSLTPQH
ncbi:protein tesmin/TSO1-like CXC 2 [Argentina anserina]|uniref:protein tesmin/TSO1-like CXC 2 n=1 Tax=Argentina anserina TaxID=57926 RepID=UPI0021766EDD|nr:protein tesmin/TSO1-like CXC 2 [Potentilla anserina]